MVRRRMLKIIRSKKQAKFQWLQDPSEINGDNLNNVRHEASKHFRNKKREYLKEKINDLATNSKNKNVRDLYRGIIGFKGATNREIHLCYQTDYLVLLKQTIVYCGK
jgi:hypothetical protein